MSELRTEILDEIWNKMNRSEKFGCKFSLFPFWTEKYKLTTQEVVELMRRSESETGTLG